MKTLREYECGCKITSDKNYPSVEYCPKHKSAPDMYEALRAIEHDIQLPELYLPSIQIAIHKLLAKVEGQG